MELLPELATLDKIEYVGLMTMAPFEASSDELKEIFKATQDLQLEIREKQIPNMPMTDLSMGMSRDYKEAIEFWLNICQNWFSIFLNRKELCL